MADPTNDLDDLLSMLERNDWHRYHRALTALVAERNALRKRVEVGERQLRLANIDQFNTEADANDRDRELRERLVCAIWPQMLRSFDQPSDDGSRYEWQEVKAKAIKEALDEANKMLAAMRKGEQDGK